MNRSCTQTYTRTGGTNALTPTRLRIHARIYSTMCAPIPIQVKSLKLASITATVKAMMEGLDATEKAAIGACTSVCVCLSGH